jgi:hypothetical protein
LNKSRLFVLLMLCPLAFSQGTFSGPGVLSRSSSGIGQRSGQDVDLKYYVNAAAISDTGVTPYAITPKGELLQPGALRGVEFGLGGYGKHTFRRSSVGLDYAGNFRHYPSGSKYDGSNQQLAANFTYQKSRRLLFDFSETAGTQSYGTAIGGSSGDSNAFFDSNSIIFDNRTSYLQSSMTTRYAISGRTTISMGGHFYLIQRQATGLIGVRGYSLNGSINRQLSRDSIIGVNYQHTHYDFPKAFGQSDIDMYTGSWSTRLGRTWTLAVSGGVFTVQVQGVESTALDPAIAALLGISSIQTIFYSEKLLPTGQATLTKRFRRASLSGNFNRMVTPGNGVFLTSRQESYGGSYSYTGFRRWSLSVLGGVTKLSSLGQTLKPYTQFNGSASVTYRVGSGLNVTGMYARRRQDIQSDFFRKDSSRISIGIAFSPGSVPISFH